jgi:hypothetical protein
VETAAVSLKFFRDNRYRFKHISFYPVCLYPGSKLYNDAVKSGKITPSSFFENTTYFSPPFINLTSLSATQFLVMDYYVAHARIAYAHNRNIELDFYRENGKTYFRYRCNCCGKNRYTAIDLDRWIRDPGEVAIYMDSFICEYCGDAICNAALRIFYDTMGENLNRFLKRRRCALRCCGIELMMFAEHLVDCDFMFIDRKIKFTAEDWREFETALGDPPVMSRILREHPAQKSLPAKADIDTLIVLVDRHYDAIKAEVRQSRPEVKVIRYTDCLFQPDGPA